MLSDLIIDTALEAFILQKTAKVLPPQLPSRREFLIQNDKKVRQLSDKFFKEFLRSRRAAMTNAEYRSWREEFDAGVEHSKQKMKQQMLTNVIATAQKGKMPKLPLP